MKASELSKICKEKLLLFGNLELEVEGRSGLGSVGNEIEKSTCLFAGLARGLKCHFERWVGDNVVDSHDNGC